MKALAKHRAKKASSAPAAPPAPAPHPPITSIYTDRVLTWEAFQAFMSDRLEMQYGDQWPRYMCGDYISSRAMRGLLQGVSWDEYNQRAEMLQPHATFFQTVWSDWIVASGQSENNQLHPVNEANWRAILMVLRFRITQPAFSVDNDRHDPFVTPRYVNWMATTHDLFPAPQHYLHLHPTDPKLIRFYDEKALERDIPIATTISKYVKRYWPDTPDAVIRAVADAHKREYVDEGVVFFTSLEDMVRVYINGPESCMAHDEMRFSSHVHPLAVYADMPGIQLAATEGELTADGQRKYSGRSFVYETRTGDKRFIRVYGDGILTDRLRERGYKQGNWKGAKLRKIPAKQADGTPLPDTWVMPYLDDVNRGETSNPVQWVTTTHPDEPWTVVSGEDRDNAYAATRTNGLVGENHAYSRFRPKYWAAVLRGHLVDEPSGFFRESEIGERRCRMCNAIFATHFLKPFYRTRVEEQSRICPSCITAQGDRVYTFDDAIYLYECCAAILPSKPDTVLLGTAFMVNKEFLRDRAAAKVVRINDLEEEGFVPLNTAMYGSDIWMRQNENLVELDGWGWCYKKDVVVDVLGNTQPRPRTWFLGQNNDEAMQFFPADGELLRRELSLGRFFVLGDKITYEATGEFRPIERREIFAKISEFDEDEDDVVTEPLEVLTRVPLVDFLSLVASAGAQRYFGFGESYTNALRLRRNYIADYMQSAFKSLLPRVDPIFIRTAINIFHELNSDAYAGLDGISNIAGQVQHLWQQLDRAPADAFRRKKERGTDTAAPHLSKLHHSRQLKDCHVD